MTVAAPRPRNSSSNSSGLVPLSSTSAGSRKRMRQVPDRAPRPPSGSGWPARLAPRPRRPIAPAGRAALRRRPDRLGPGASIRLADVVLGGQRHGRSAAGSAGSWPLRTRSKAFSRWWVKAATASKPNIAPEPLMVCRARKAVSISSLVVGGLLQVEQRRLQLDQQVRGFLAERSGRDRMVAHQPSTFLTTPSSCSCWNGLTIQAVAPAALASSLLGHRIRW